ncbi:MAG: hypothetical protein ACFFDI_14180 [Promethearchaeota archaeon]
MDSEQYQRFQDTLPGETQRRDVFGIPVIICQNVYTTLILCGFHEHPIKRVRFMSNNIVAKTGAIEDAIWHRNCRKVGLPLTEIICVLEDEQQTLVLETRFVKLPIFILHYVGKEPIDELLKKMIDKFIFSIEISRLLSYDLWGKNRCREHIGVEMNAEGYPRLVMTDPGYTFDADYIYHYLERVKFHLNEYVEELLML